MPPILFLRLCSRTPRLKRFSATFSELSGIPEDDLSNLQFIDTTQGRKVDVVKRHDNEATWENFKVKLRRLVSQARKDNSAIMEFEILVSAVHDGDGNSAEEDLGGL